MFELSSNIKISISSTSEHCRPTFMFTAIDVTFADEVAIFRQKVVIARSSWCVQ